MNALQDKVKLGAHCGCRAIGRALCGTARNVEHRNMLVINKVSTSIPGCDDDILDDLARALAVVGQVCRQ